MGRFGILAVAVLLGAVAPMAFAQTGAAAFDVATIKPHPGWPDRQAGLHYHADGITAELTVWQLVGEAYKSYSAGRVSGAPDWAKNDWYDVEAKMSDADTAEMKKLSPEESKKRSDLMLQALLAERFKLKVHSETKQVPVYELVVAKGGAKLQDAATDPAAAKLGGDGKPFTGIHETGPNTSVVQNYSMKAFADYLLIAMHSLGRPVVDKTGLTGNYNFTLDWSIYSASARPSTAGVASDPGDDGDFLRDALKKVGLGLQPANDATEYIVIDQVERPTAN